ncbi:MAG: HD-GYP domain-containing protein [Sedimentisphaerales bacterium]|nr:HD-GYP domain-containing protein [Sedimentisphaerales bacterium]
MTDHVSKSFSPSQLRELKKFGSRINKLGANFAAANSNGDIILLSQGDKFQSDKHRLLEAALCALNQVTDSTKGGLAQKTQTLTAVLRQGSEAVGTAMIDLGDSPENSKFTPMADVMFSEMLELMAENFQSAIKIENEVEKIGTELAHTYEELVLLHKLSTNMKVTEHDVNFLQMACDCLTELVLVEGIAVLLEKTVEGEKRTMVVAGSGLIDMDERMSALLHSRLADEINNGKEALLDSDVYSPLKYEWPETIRNIIAVPLCGKERPDSNLSHQIKNGTSIIGSMVAINRVDKPDFDSTDVKLFNSVACGCAVFIENGRLFNDLKELFIGSLRALTSSIDAKDKYTRGHSERVAFISRWIAEKFAEKETLDQEKIYKIYLAGLMHDIGKIGIDEAVLRKEGPLTEHDLELIRSHPSIGASILNVIKQMRDIVPGVLSHHERIDGKGYPQGLSGEQIPLTAKIVGLADSFDAMTSKRTYRDAKTIEQALAEIEKGLDKQFDRTVGGVFLDSDVYQLWDILQNDFNINISNNSSEYGIAAVGTLIR